MDTRPPPNSMPPSPPPADFRPVPGGPARPAGFAPRTGGREIRLGDILRLLDKRRRVIFTFFALVVGTVFLVTASLKKIYTAQGFLMVDEEFNRKWDATRGLGLSIIEMERAYSTVQRIANSYEVVEEVVKRLREKYPDLPRESYTKPIPSASIRLRQKLADWLGTAPPGVPWHEDKIGEHDLLDPFVIGLQRKITVELIQGTALMRVEVEHTDPNIAQDTCNWLMEIFIQRNYDQKINNVTRAITYFTKQLDEMRQKMGQAENKAYEYLVEQNIANPIGTEKAVAANTLEKLTAEITEIRRNKKEMEAKYSELRKISQSSNPLAYTAWLDTIDDTSIFSEVDKRRADLDLTLVTLRQRYKEQHPDVMAANAELEGLKQKYLQKVNDLLASTSAAINVITEKENHIEKAIADFNREAMDLAKKSVEYRILNDESHIATKIYQDMLDKLSSLDLTAQIQTASYQIVQRAKLPLRHSKPNMSINLLSGVVIGLLGGLGMAFLQEFLDRSIRTPEDAEEYLGLPVLALIPTLEGDGQSRVYY